MKRAHSVRRPLGQLEQTRPNPCSHPTLTHLRRPAGNRATSLLIQREKNRAVTRATDPDDTASIIWRDGSGVITKILEIESNETLDRYLDGSVTALDLVETGRAIWSSMGVGGGGDRDGGEPTEDDGTDHETDTPTGESEAETQIDDPDMSDLPAWMAKILQSTFNSIRTSRLLVYQASRDAQRTAATVHSEIKSLKRIARGLGNRIAHSGGGAKVAAELAKADAEILRLETFLAGQARLISEANRAVQAEQKAGTQLLTQVRHALHGGGARERAAGFVWRNVWKVAGPIVKRINASAKASAHVSKYMVIVRALSNPWVSRALMGVSAVLEGVTGYLQSHNQTTAGKLANATLAGAGGALIVANPAVLLADLVLPKGYKPSEVYRGGASAISAIGEGLVTGDTRGMEGVHEASLNGEYGRVMQSASEAGDFWADEGVVGGLSEFGSELVDFLF